MSGATLRSAQRAIDRAGVPVELQRCPDGYHIFIFDRPDLNVWDTVSEMVPYTSHLSPAEWVERAGIAMNTIKADLADRGITV